MADEASSHRRFTQPGDAAVVYARLGWPVLPCHSPRAAGCSCHQADCSSPAKHPRTPRGLTDATTDEALLRQWWARWPDANVAVATGARAGIVVIDIDPAHGGHDSLQQLLDRHGTFPETHVVHTGGGGLHFYFAHPGGIVRNQASRLGPGIDVRGDGGYVLAPPSRHTSGRRYQPGNDHRHLAAMPSWLTAALRPPARPPTVPVGVRPSSAWADAALTGEADLLNGAQPGSRNHTLNRSAYRLGQIVATGALDEPYVAGVLAKAAHDIGLGEREAARTIASGLTAGRQHPRGPKPQARSRGLGLA